MQPLFTNPEDRVSRDLCTDNIPLRPNYFIFIGYLKRGGQGGGSSELPEPPPDPPLIRTPTRSGITHVTDLFSKP